MKTEEQLKQIYSKNLRKRLDARGVSPYFLAQQISIMPRTVYLYLNADSLPNSYYLYLIANFFGCSLDEMFEEEE